VQSYHQPFGVGKFLANKIVVGFVKL